ncbi:hypothetical protein, partial [Bacteroides heparinolyticus]|uniref:hypothetical protein n=1 Tax=Prevotella heparinolytica TaxID=28113 RepID=UPI00359FE4C5
RHDYHQTGQIIYPKACECQKGCSGIIRACLNFPEIIFYWFYQPVLIFFSVYLPVFIRHIARYAPHKNRQISSKINLKTVSSKI